MNRDALLYHQVTERMIQLIESGSLEVGDKTPSIRRLSFDLKVSISTVVKAYEELERSGHVESRPQSGFYVRAARLAEPEPAAANLTPKLVGISRLTQMVYETAYDPKVVPLGAAVPAPEILPIRQLNAAVARTMRRQPTKATSYLFPPGFEALRKQIAKRTLAWDRPLSTSEILITNGAMEAVTLSLRAITKPGDMVVVESPTYFGMLQSLESLGLLVVEIPFHKTDGINLAALSQAVSKHKVAACLFTLNYNNPSGGVMPDPRKKELVSLLAKHEVPLIEDDVYGDLCFSGKRPMTAKAYDRGGNVILCSSFSKTLGPGLRIGWVSGGRFHAKVMDLKFTSTIAAPSLQQLALADFLATGAYERHLAKLRRTIGTTVDHTTKTIFKHFPSGTKVSRPLGGMALWVAMPKSIDSVRLYRQAIAQGIGMTPGILFSPRKTFSNCLRLNCANLWSPAIERALAALGRLASI